MSKIAIKDIEQAAERIAPNVLHTPLVEAKALSAELGVTVSLKLETLQATGSFKLRGATNAMALLSADERARGVITASSGNHGPALACAAARQGVRAVICLSRLVPANKVDNVCAHGGETHIAGRDFDESLVEARALIEEHGLVLVHAFDDPRIVAGAGTCGLEIAQDMPDAATVLVPLSGGGLLGGVATAIRAKAPGTRVVGVTMERGASMYHSLKAGKPVDIEEVETVADALGGNIGMHNEWTFEAVRDYVDDAVLVTEEEIRRAMRYLFRTQGLVVEGAGAVGIAALMNAKVASSGPAVCVVSGRNVAPEQFLEIVSQAE